MFVHDFDPQIWVDRIGGIEVLRIVQVHLTKGSEARFTLPTSAHAKRFSSLHGSQGMFLQISNTVQLLRIVCCEFVTHSQMQRV